ncbi:hypothetical protein QE152_g37448 [Popillia japonica]|uniref:Uncharacterized protein n=1 Tax=Popillia japonica TaxID=7064 RepID=A0AAW1IAH1_POPJA
MDTDVLNTCSASYNRKSDRPHNLSGKVDSTVPPGSLSQSVTEDHSYTSENPTINNYGLWIVQFRREVCPSLSLKIIVILARILQSIIMAWKY